MARPEDNGVINYDQIVQGVITCKNEEGEPAFTWPLFDYMVELAKCAAELQRLGNTLACNFVIESLQQVNKAAMDGIMPPILRGEEP